MGATGMDEAPDVTDAAATLAVSPPAPAGAALGLGVDVVAMAIPVAAPTTSPAVPRSIASSSSPDTPLVLTAGTGTAAAVSAATESTPSSRVLAASFWASVGADSVVVVVVVVVGAGAASLSVDCVLPDARPSYAALTPLPSGGYHVLPSLSFRVPSGAWKGQHHHGCSSAIRSAHNMAEPAFGQLGSGKWRSAMTHSTIVFHATS